MTEVISNSLKNAKNIGPTIEKQLNAIGVFSLSDLAGLTPIKAYYEICKMNPGKTLPVCYYLYSLQGALLNLHWNDLPNELKLDLKKQATELRVKLRHS